MVKQDCCMAYKLACILGVLISRCTGMKMTSVKINETNLLRGHGRGPVLLQ